MTKATAIKPLGCGALAFTDPADNASVFVGKVEPKEADGQAPKALRGQKPATDEQLTKLADRFKK